MNQSGSILIEDGGVIKWREGVFEAEAAMFDVFIIIWRDGGLIEFIIIWRELFIAEDVGDIEQLG